MNLRVLCLLLILTGIGRSLNAQTLPVGLLENVEDAYRRQQLLGKDSSGSSYMIRPLFLSDVNYLSSDIGNSALSLNQFRTKIYADEKYKTAIYALPVVWQQQFNSHHPYGMNDGAMVQARGYQTQFSAGVFARIGPLSIQLRPEYVFAENKGFRKLSDAPNGEIWNSLMTVYYRYIDLPDRFNDGNYSKLSWGQSSIRLNAGPVSLGLSNENLWWGPGVRNSLIMSNNASGFKHFTLNTTRPVKTPVGSFEAQVIAGRLELSGADTLRDNGALYKPKDWRYLSALVLTYQPKWVPDLYLGFNRVYTVNRLNMGNSFSDYFPVFGGITKAGYTDEDGNNREDAAQRDQSLSFFLRYILPKSKAEIYFEYGRNDHSYDLRDGISEPEHSRAYVAGFRKLFPVRSADEYIQFGLEFTQMEAPGTRDTRSTPPWYQQPQVKGGYTNRGQVIGAGIGPGSNLQSIDLSWVKGLRKIGLQLERLVNDNDLLYRFANGSTDKNQFYKRHWVDLSVGGKFAWTFKKVVLNSQLTYIRSLNYQYQSEQASGSSDQQNVDNLHLKVGLMYNL